MTSKALSIAGLAVAWTWGPALALLPSAGAAADDAQGGPLRAAERNYRDAIAQARGQLLEAFQSRLETASSNLRLKSNERSALVELIGQERDAFRDAGRIPASPRLRDDVRKYRRALQRSEDECRRSFEAAAKASRERGDLPAATAATASWERLFLETADLEAFPDRWLRLFDGVSLNGWSIDRGQGEAWRVESGDLVARRGAGSAAAGSLLIEREFRDFLLSFEFQLDADSDSGVVLRAGRDELSHLELNLRSFRETPSFHGFLFWSRSGNARDGLQPAPLERANGAWNRAEIELQGGLLRVTINGRLAHSTDLGWFADRPEAVPGVSRPSGRIGFQLDAGTARFRNVRVRGVSRADGTAGTGRLPRAGGPVIPAPGRFYRVINEESGKALDVLHSSLVGGGVGVLVQAVVAGRPSQAWTLRARRERYQIVNGNSRLVINIPLGRQEDGNGVIQWPDQNGAGNELWVLIPEGRAFRITSTNGLAITVNDRGRVEMRTPQGKPNELWRFVPATP